MNTNSFHQLPTDNPPQTDQQIADQFIDKTVLFKNNIGVEWPGFIRWLEYFGALSPLPNSNQILFDPTPFILAYWSELWGSQKNLTASQFVKQLGKLVPFMDSGSLLGSLQPQLTENARSILREDELSLSLSLALHRLKHDEMIDFVAAKADAGTTHYLWTPQGAPPEPISGINRRKKMP